MIVKLIASFFLHVRLNNKVNFAFVFNNAMPIKNQVQCFQNIFANSHLHFANLANVEIYDEITCDIN